VEKEQVLHGMKKSVTTFPCLLCEKSFDARWKLNRHNGDSHQPETGYSHVGKPGQYTCKVCHKTMETKGHWNRHVFLHHSDVEVYSRYCRTVEELIGDCRMGYLRGPLFTALMSGKWDRLLGQLISPAAPLEYAKLDYYYSWEHDTDTLNSERRELWYEKEREMLLKLATTVAEEGLLDNCKHRQDKNDGVTLQLGLDLRSWMLNEELPRILLRTLKFSKLAVKHKITCLPSFISLERVQCQVRHSMKSLPLAWSSVIQDQELLLAKGNDIFTALVNAVTQLMKNKIVLRAIHPDHVRFSEDLKLVVFNNIENACMELEEDGLVNPCPAPYDTTKDSWFSLLHHAHHLRDVYAIGLLLLEVLVGP
jgi:hypothetical protein